MNQWAFVAAAYAVTLGGTGALALISWLQMRRAERPASSDVEWP
jgi:hypothetical protein